MNAPQVADRVPWFMNHSRLPVPPNAAVQPRGPKRAVSRFANRSAARIGYNGLLADEFVVVCVSSDPEPDNSRRGVGAKCAVVKAYARRPDVTNLLEMERRVLGVRLEECVLLVGEPLNSRRECSVTGPEARARGVLQSSVHLPAL